jgi:hypothetical protein
MWKIGDTEVVLLKDNFRLVVLLKDNFRFVSVPPCLRSYVPMCLKYLYFPNALKLTFVAPNRPFGVEPCKFTFIFAFESEL